MARKVDFFIAGVQKGGTTALDSYLRRHPGLQLARQKEVHFFDDEKIDWSDPPLDALHGQFDWAADNVRRGEATPIYSYWQPSLARLHAYNPSARIVLALRHPSFRAHSHWRMEVARNRDDVSFEEAISENGRQRVCGAPGGQHRTFSYVERGFYAQQVAALLDLFPPSQLHFLRTDRLWADAAATITALEDFLGVDRCLGSTLRPEYVVPLNTNASAGPPLTARRVLDELYRDDIVATARLTGLDLGDWMSPDYAEPMRG